MAKSRKTTKSPENTARHADWLALIDISGGFLDADILNEKCGSGLERLPLATVQQITQFYAAWRNAVDTHDPDLDEYHRTWFDAVYYNLLGYAPRDFMAWETPTGFFGDSPYILEGPDGARFEATRAMMREGKIAFYIRECEPDQNLDEIPQDGWNLSLTERMARLCRKNQVCLGLLTNGEQWRVVYSPTDIHESASHATWYARIWSQERETMHAFAMFMGVRRSFGNADDRIEALIDASRKQQKSVSDTLETQVAHAIETLIRCLDRADIDRNRKLLAGVSEREVYEAALTVMMRLVFILCAEERKLLLDNELYDAHYAATTLREQLLTDQAELGDAVLEIRHDAWTRLLALFRAIYGGIRYEDLRMPPLGGNLFDPDKYPFLEGRDNSTSWRDTPANPLPIDNRTVLLLLNALQVLSRRTGAQTISYKTLGIEQIGHVYEGLLELTVIRAKETMIGISAPPQQTKQAKGEPFISSATTVDGINIALEKLERRVFDGDDPAQILKKVAGKRDADRFRSALHRVCNTQELYRRVEPYLDYIRADAWGEPCVIYPGSFMLVAGTDRRETGAHYTPRFLTEQIVATTLGPLVYEGTKTGTPREQWRVRSAAQLLDLRICDPAMGSGAFLVQACRYLGERLVEAWKQAESLGMKVTDTGAVVATLDDADPMTANEEERLTQARRLIAERCLYGVDINPLAVELAKLSIWLVTLSKGRPFCFLDHQLKCGDSLVGVRDTRQIVNLNMNPDAPMSASFFKAAIDQAVEEARALRKQIQATRVISIDDIDAMRALHDKAQMAMQRAGLLADAMCGIAMREAQNAKRLDNALGSLKNMAGSILNGDAEQFEYERQKAQSDLNSGLPAGKPPLRTFHWALEYPEVFDAERGGFDAICGNPPFMGGQHLTGNFGTNYRDYLVAFLADNTSGSADLVAYFYLRAASLLKSGGCFGLLATDTIAQGDTRQVGLERMVQNGATIYDATPSMKWPGKGASLNVAIVHIYKGDDYRGTRRLNGKKVDHISAFLSDTEEYSPQRLPENGEQSYIGSYILGTGWLMSEQEARNYIARDAKNAEVLYPYLGGEDLNSTPDQRATRWVINFFDWPLARDAQGSWCKLDEKAREKAIRAGHVPADYPNRVAEDFPELLQIVREKVKPERDKITDPKKQKRRNLWWQYAEPSTGLYHAIGRGAMFALHPKGWNSDLPPLPKGEGECGTSTQPQNYKYVLATVLVTKYFAPSFVENNNVFNHKTCIITINEYNKHALLNSSIINIWVWKTSSRNNVSLNFSPSDSYETLPFPEHYDGALEGLGHELEEARRAVIGELTGAKSCGLTAIYNLYHDPSETGESIERLRDIHRRIDEAVCRSYGWGDIKLDHGFYETEGLPANDCIRYTISPDAQREVLKRLFALNKSRAEAAKAAKATTPAPKGSGGRGAKPKASDGQGSLF